MGEKIMDINEFYEKLHLDSYTGLPHIASRQDLLELATQTNIKTITPAENILTASLEILGDEVYRHLGYDQPESRLFTYGNRYYESTYVIAREKQNSESVNNIIVSACKHNASKFREGIKLIRFFETLNKTSLPDASNINRPSSLYQYMLCSNNGLMDSLSKKSQQRVVTTPIIDYVTSSHHSNSDIRRTNGILLSDKDSIMLNNQNCTPFDIFSDKQHVLGALRANETDLAFVRNLSQLRDMQFVDDDMANQLDADLNRLSKQLPHIMEKMEDNANANLFSKAQKDYITALTTSKSNEIRDAIDRGRGGRELESHYYMTDIDHSMGD